MLKEIQYYCLLVISLAGLFLFFPIPSFSESGPLVGGLSVKKGPTHVLVGENISYMITDRTHHGVASVYGFDDGLDYNENQNSEGGLADYFQNISLKDCLQGQSVLDLASGGGAVVKYLRKKNSEAYGIDLLEPLEKNQERLEHSFFKDMTIPYAYSSLTEGSMTDMPYKDESFERMISTWGPFSYFEGRMSEKEREEQLIILEKSLIEIKRVLKNGGMALMGPLAETYWGDPLPLTVFTFVEKEIKRNKWEGMKSYRGLGRPSSVCAYCPYIIITKGEVSPSSFCKSKK